MPEPQSPPRLHSPDHPDAEERRERADQHRSSWLRGYRGVLGMA